MRYTCKFVVTMIFMAVILHLTGRAKTSQGDSLVQKGPLKSEIRVDIGNVLPTNAFVKAQNKDADGLAHYTSYSLRLAKQTTGDNLWQQLYGFPLYGVGIYSAFFKDTPKLGNPIAIYGFFNAPFFRTGRWSLNYELGLGYTMNWNSYNPVENPNNIAISADNSVYIDAALNLKYLLSEKLSLTLGYGFTHFSNGALKMPNKGLNTESARISVSYNFNQGPIHYYSRVIPPFKDYYEWIISGYGGARNMIYMGADVSQAIRMKGVNYAVYGISSTLNHQINYKSKVGLGITMEFNGSQNTQIVVENGLLDGADLPFQRHLALSIYPSYELVLNNLSLIIQPGLYLYRMKTSNMTPSFYQRIGVKYHFIRDTFIGINLRAYNFYESDFIEWTIGHRVCW